MVDFLSGIHGIPLCNQYDRMRGQKLEKVIYPKDVELARKLSPELDVREQSRKEAIPEFMRFNIVEKEIRNVY